MDGGATIPSAAGALPMVGHSWSLLRDPLAFLSTLPAYGDLVEIRVGSISMVMVCDPTLTRRVLMDDRTYDKGGPVMETGNAYGRKAAEVIGDGLITCPHSRHRRQRRLCQPSFHPDQILVDGLAFASAAEAMASSWRDGQVIDVNRELMTMTAGTAVQTMSLTRCRKRRSR